jgi:hypothetical protein
MTQSICEKKPAVGNSVLHLEDWGSDKDHVIAEYIGPIYPSQACYFSAEKAQMLNSRPIDQSCKHTRAQCCTLLHRDVVSEAQGVLFVI